MPDQPDDWHSPGPRPNTVRAAGGEVLEIPAGWELLPPGDPAATRRVKAAGPHFLVQERRGRKVFSHGVHAPKETVARVLAELAAERADPQHAKKQLAAKDRRDRAQAEYVEDFRGAVLRWLNFDVRYLEEAGKLAGAVAAHATPVGSGTVARTERIPIEDRAAAAVIAWMRHQTTAYDSLAIARVKGRRREVRRNLAAESKATLSYYRRGADIPAGCPLAHALAGIAETGKPRRRVGDGRPALPYGDDD